MSDTVVFVVIVLARLLVPLLILRFPIPAILACLVVDAADQSIFESYTTLVLADYQTYDKALDVYYLTLAYVSTIRNWGGGPDFVAGAALWYYRLVGVALFEFTSARWLLLVFPNTFEYYFVAIELFKVGRDPNKLVVRQVVKVAAVIWVVIKLPQEWWIHIAQLDVTDAVKEHLFGVEADSRWGSAIANRPLVTVALIAAAVAVAAGIAMASRRLPPREWPTTFDADRQAKLMGWRTPRRLFRPRAFFGWQFLEKVVLVALVASIFARILPGANARLPTMALITAYMIAMNTLLSQWLARRGTSWRNALVAFVMMGSANLAVLLVTAAAAGAGSGSTPLGTTLFLVGLLTLIVELYDHAYGIFADEQERRLARAGATDGRPAGVFT